MFTKAANLLGEGREISVPKNDDQVLVSRDNNSYIVQKSVRGMMQCYKKTCSSFEMLSICSHCTAVAKHERGLASYLTAFNKVHRTKNLSKACQFGIPPGAGTKDGKGKSKKETDATYLLFKTI